MRSHGPSLITQGLKNGDPFPNLVKDMGQWKKKGTQVAIADFKGGGRVLCARIVGGFQKLGRARKQAQGLQKGTQSVTTLILPQDTHVGLLTHRTVR